MSKRMNEITAMMRSEPQAYIAEYDANQNVEYEAWASPGSATTSAVWLAAKHTYDANQNLTKTEWAQDSSSRVAQFTNTATSLSSLTYV